MNEQTLPMITLSIDGHSVTVPKGTTVYKAAQQLKIDVPVFCYIDQMPPFGACRMCLVEVEKSPKLQTSCTLEATEGMVVKTQSDPALSGRKEILELLLINHPLDCPICDKGGECPLQDHTMECGPGKSQFYEEKRHFKKQLPLSPVLMLDRERCIICARCTRFGELIAGDTALQFIDRGYTSEVGTPDGQPAKSKFIGNTIKICPVGALTSRAYRFQSRPWDNKPTESTCTLCPVGCSMAFDQRDGEIVRTRSTENLAVNDIWLCDKGWFGFEFIHHPDRLQKPLIRKNGALTEASWDEAISLIAEKITAAKPNGKLAALGGTPLTTEELYLFQKLMREVAGVNNVDYRTGAPITDEMVPPGMELPIEECDKLDYAVFLGLDLTEEFPVLWLRLKQAINKGAKVLFLGHFAPEVTHQISQTVLHAPGQELPTLERLLPEIAALKGKGAFFVGRQYLASESRGQVLQKLLAFKKERTSLSLNIMEGRGNSMGARFAGMHPAYRSLGKALDEPGLNWVEVLEEASKSGWDFIYVAGANVAAKCPKALWKQVREKLGFLVVQDLFLTETAQDADVVLPTLCYAEKTGYFHNIEGRGEPLQPGRPIPEDLFSDGEIFIWLARILKTPLGIGRHFSQFLSTSGMHPSLPFSYSSKQTQVKSSSPDALKATFTPKLFDNGVRMMHNVHLAKMCDEPFVRINSSEAKKRSLSCGDTIQLKNGDITLSAKLKVDSLVSEGTIVIPLGFKAIPTAEWGLNLLNGLEITVFKDKP